MRFHSHLLLKEFQSFLKKNKKPNKVSKEYQNKCNKEFIIVSQDFTKL